MKRRECITLFGGAALTWPLTAGMQRAAMPAVGLLTVANLPEWAKKSMFTGLAEAGYVEGRNLTIISRSAEGRFSGLSALAADLVSNRVAVILAAGSPVPARAAKAATTKIPIVFAYGGDPVADGLVDSLNGPGANMTGATFIGTALLAKRMELLREIVPHATEVALLVNPSGTLAEPQITDAKAAAQELGQRLHVIDASNDGEIDAAFVTMRRLKVDALVVSTDPFFGMIADHLAELALRYKIPAIYNGRDESRVGGLVSYGPDKADTWRQSALYVSRILRGEKPWDLPVVQPTRFEMVINLRTAKALGLAIPPNLLGLADEVFE
jgi:putative tryptophan/tyrosine transport system substrate-binding protein